MEELWRGLASVDEWIECCKGSTPSSQEHSRQEQNHFPHYGSSPRIKSLRDRKFWSIKGYNLNTMLASSNFTRHHREGKREELSSPQQRFRLNRSTPPVGNDRNIGFVNSMQGWGKTRRLAEELEGKGGGFDRLGLDFLNDPRFAFGDWLAGSGGRGKSL